MFLHSGVTNTAASTVHPHMHSLTAPLELSLFLLVYVYSFLSTTCFSRLVLLKCILVYNMPWPMRLSTKPVLSCVVFGSFFVASNSLSNYNPTVNSPVAILMPPEFCFENASSSAMMSLQSGTMGKPRLLEFFCWSVNHEEVHQLVSCATFSSEPANQTDRDIPT